MAFLTLTNNSHFIKLLELKQRIEFLRNDVDSDILIGAVERELSQSFDFQCTFNSLGTFKPNWSYYIRCTIRHSTEYGKKPNSIKLEALYEAIDDLTKLRAFAK